MKAVRNTFLSLGALLSLFVLGLVSAVQMRWDRTFDVPYPELHASTDSATIAYGRYLVYGPAHCADCHRSVESGSLMAAGSFDPLVGGTPFVLPIGTIYTPNITMDDETGIGRFTDPEIARMLRHNVRRDGQATIPFMAFESMSDEDIVAILSFLRSQEAIRHEVPASSYNLMGKGVKAFLLEPTFAAETPPISSPPAGPTIERGAYIANNVANCAGCHTNRDMATGAAIGPLFAGGFEMVDEEDPTRTFITPNLTSDPETGYMANWTEEAFTARFRAGKVYPGSHMPWYGYAMMSDDDIVALYRYLMSLDPVRNDVAPIVRTSK
jgi:mono/diheme cytochrome c family protein